jgi:hypothetical protein
LFAFVATTKSRSTEAAEYLCGDKEMKTQAEIVAEIDKRIQRIQGTDCAWTLRHLKEWILEDERKG